MMNKTLTAFLLICFSLGFAQEKKITFNKKLQYQFVEKRKTTDFVMYSSKNNETLTQIDNKGFPMTFYADKLGLSNVNFAMNNRLTDASFMGSYFGYNDPYEPKKETSVTFEKLSTKENIAGISCHNYILNFKRNDEEKVRDDDKIKACIDDKNEINNVPVLFKMLDQFSRSKTKNTDLKGLILKIGPKDSYDKEYAILKSNKDVQDFVYFDHPKSMMNQQRKTDSLLADYQRQEAEYEKYPIDSVTVADAIDETYYPADSTYVGVPPPPSADFNYGYLPEYESIYKQADYDEPNLAITGISQEDVWKSLPKHCRKIEENLPKLDDKEFKKHLKNYVGQMCDMYFTQSEYHSVGIKITLDEIRREVLYINENKEKLKSSDKKKVDQYLENLD